MGMKWILPILLIFLCGLLICLSDTIPLDRIGRLSQGYGKDTFTSSVPSDVKQLEEMAEILKLLDLPADFLVPKKPILNSNPRNTSLSSMDIPGRTERKSDFFMTGNHELDSLLDCPCPYSQLTESSLSSSQNFYNDPQTPEPKSYGWSHSSTSSYRPLRGGGWSKGKLIGELVGRLLESSRSKWPLVKPVILSLADSSATATQKVARLSAQASRNLPPFVEDSAEVLKQLTLKVGDLTGHLLYTMTPVISSAAAASRSFADRLPYALEVLGYQGKQAMATAGKLAHHFAHTSDLVSSGVATATNAKVKLFTKFVQGGQQFKKGVAEGIKSHQNGQGWASTYAVANTNGQAWGWRR